MVAACYEIVLNRSYQELAEHYDTAIVPARVEHPKNKSLAKGTAWIALCHFTRELLPSVFEISIIV